jgi:hypothetical protein
MSLDLSDAIALAKDLLKTGIEFRPHDPEMAEEFMGRALQICDDLGIDRKQILEDHGLDDASDILGTSPFGGGGAPVTPQRVTENADHAFLLHDDAPIDEPTDDRDDNDLILGANRTTSYAEPADNTVVEEETRQTSQQLRALLQQQARVLQNSREPQALADSHGSRRRGFKLFGRSNDQPFAALQSA